MDRDKVLSLAYPSLAFEVDSAEIAQGRVPEGGIVETLDVIEHVDAPAVSFSEPRAPVYTGSCRWSRATPAYAAPRESCA